LLRFDHRRAAASLTTGLDLLAAVGAPPSRAHPKEPVELARHRADHVSILTAPLGGNARAMSSCGDGVAAAAEKVNKGINCKYGTNREPNRREGRSPPQVSRARRR
jgi:hypothetical protein